ncbi:MULTISPECIES: NO-inducible flavohemoprotein [Achromobacter]|jgi:nitric oxide dioxygenase|uniref:Flavohemoprotein n=1 Tax=Achromobacter aegrifaciens TaxID=1287736 RepID=A0AAD2J4Y5_ACHAE|nr:MULTISPECIES: NO-inducible flavohemoprotein [Achromobacter]PTN52931.1 NO-inducible flavohemoprotein [Achromobacter xylosoxidans]MBD9384002.1 NO-inducible flavohemoprotein [Achromobacter sp. ACM02]MBD9417802.1 NO-inducible flavohemoprotein [Achromobacter sp. ACM04]MBD9433410.1 NO-inducible flavohemoprotein [Achromobacter sp. ACM03]MBD9476638.1 NO-inducible flavohemoprotein [Achromobacter sp. ACM01]
MLSPQIRALVKGTAPVLKTHGVALTKHFYARMFKHNPELKHVFNQGHQAGGEQQQALAGAVAAYAEHIDDPSVLMPVVTRIVHKHVSLGIRPEHYQIVGKHLLASISEVLGEAATEELVAAWAAAYGQLADLLIAEEARLYAESAAKPGGWTGWRAFRVVGKQRESAEITSFYLAPADGGEVPAYRPGQYVSVRVFVPELGLMQPRQYSLSDAPGQDRLRISVKREAAGADTPAGRVSNALHDRLEEGGVLDVAPPQGDFHLREEGSAPVVLLSGGVGLTPMVSILNHLVGLNDERQIRFVHGCRNNSVHAMRDHVNSIAAERANVRKAVFYEEVGHGDQPGRDYDYAGRVDLNAIRDEVIVPGADYYLCGPAGFMRAQREALTGLGVPADRIHAEAFGSGGAPA